nr:transmembrane emp24 domain-containing protein p24delta3-like [Ipomoea batatas]
MMNLVVLLALVSAAAVLPTGEALWLDLPSSGTKCVSEELHNNVVVLADYYIIGDEEHKVVPSFSVKVTSPYGNNLHHQENVTHGQFAFTTTESGNYLACFWMDGNLPGVNIELMKLEGLVQAIHENLNYLKEREAEMREVSERTNARVAWFSIMSIGICIVVSLVQIWRLKTFFQKKKLI